MDKIVISHLGLKDKDLTLIKNLFRLNTTWFGNFELAATSGTSEGQIILIDQDEPRARMLWRQMQAHYPKDCVISIGRSADEASLGGQHLGRPIVFRRLTEALTNATSMSKQSRASGSSQPRILVVDDNLPVRTFMKQKLHDLYAGSYGVALACSGEEAVEMAQSNTFDLVFMDVMMDGMDGYRACRQLKSIREMPVVMLTSKSSTLNRVKAHMSGCDGFITKPPDDNELMQVVSKHLSKKLPRTEMEHWATA
ncbi:MAG: response regulator [Hahellaceae bacterium]|nr:response regulator [Hahellaceae bacterium]MCP5168961.1 response regulator [Hahellaceae bacterium]